MARYKDPITVTHKEIVEAEWDYEKNEKGPENYVAGSHEKMWWICTQHRNSYHQGIREKLQKNRTSCVECLYVYRINALVTVRRSRKQKAIENNNVLDKFPEMVEKYWSYGTNIVSPQTINVGSKEIVDWNICALCGYISKRMVNAFITHYKRTNSAPPCPRCTSLMVANPMAAALWDYTKNKDTPEDVHVGSAQKRYFFCPTDPKHPSKEKCIYAALRCSYCRQRDILPYESLATLLPDIAKMLHPTLNTFTAWDVGPGSNIEAYFVCDLGHVYKKRISEATNGIGCPVCNMGWTSRALRGFLAQNLDTLLNSTSDAYLWSICKKAGIIDAYGAGPALFELLKNDLPNKEEEFGKFSRSEPSTIDELLANAKTKSPDELEIATQQDFQDTPELSTREKMERNKKAGKAASKQQDPDLRQFGINEVLAKFWRDTMRAEDEGEKEARRIIQRRPEDDATNRFALEYQQAKELVIPQGYGTFYRKGLDGKLKQVIPNLMQRYVASRVLHDRRFGNWSGTGAGKTLAAVLASRVVNAHFTLIVCPNAVVEGWAASIVEAYPDSAVQTQTWHPYWKQATHRYLIMNHEMFQMPYSESRLAPFIHEYNPAFVIVDEVHHVKATTQQQGADDENVSLRRRNLGKLFTLAQESNSDLYRMLLSATPVINNLEEALSIIELLTGTRPDINTASKTENTVAVYEQLLRLGIRHMPKYDMEFDQQIIEIDATHRANEVERLNKPNASQLPLQLLLTEERLPTIIEHMHEERRKNPKAKFVVYTKYLEGGIAELLEDEFIQEGWSVGYYVGDDKSGFNAFKEGSLDILIGTKAISTGLDGLQDVCSNLIVNILPDTAADFEQLKGRIYRQGQNKKVTLLIPQVVFHTDTALSFDRKALNRIHFKKSLADAAVDGVTMKKIDDDDKTKKEIMKSLKVWLEKTEEVAEAV